MIAFCFALRFQCISPGNASVLRFAPSVDGLQLPSLGTPKVPLLLIVVDVEVAPCFLFVSFSSISFPWFAGSMRSSPLSSTPHFVIVPILIPHFVDKLCRCIAVAVGAFANETRGKNNEIKEKFKYAAVYK